jgi:hypothetical protein
MKNNELVGMIKEDQDKLLEMLSVIAKGEGDTILRDKFLDGWVDYSGPVGLVLYDSVHTMIPNGDEVLQEFRKETEKSHFQQVFADLENAEEEDLQAAAVKALPIFKSEADRLSKELIPYLLNQLDDEQIAHLIKSYSAAHKIT